jgi:hypothetical protein
MNGFPSKKQEIDFVKLRRLADQIKILTEKEKKEQRILIINPDFNGDIGERGISKENKQ